MIGVLLALLVAALEKGMSTAAMPRAAADLNGFSRYSWTSTAELLTTTIAMLVFAKLSDLYGRKRLYLWSTLILVFGSFFCAAAGKLPVPLPGIDQLILARGLVGVGSGAILSLAFTFIADLFPPADRGRYIAVLSVAYGIGVIAGLPIGGWITDRFSWRWAFLASVPAGVVAILSLRFTLPDFQQDPRRRSIDWAGIVTLCGWLVPLMLALTLAGAGNWSTPPVRELLLVSAVMLALFCFVETRAVEPLIFFGLFRNRRIALALLNLFFQGIAVFSIVIFLPVLLQGGRGASAAQSAGVLSYVTVALFTGNLAGGQLISRTGRYRMIAMLGAGLATAGLLLLSRVDVSTTPSSLFCSAVIAGVGLGFLTPTYEVLVQNATEKSRLGIATGSTRFFYTMGSTIGTAQMGAILLKTYHRHLSAGVHQDMPEALKQLLDDPLKLLLTRPDLDRFISQLRGGKVSLENALAVARSGLVSGVHVVFWISAAIMATSCVLNLFLRDEPSRKASDQISFDP